MTRALVTLPLPALWLVLACGSEPMPTVELTPSPDAAAPALDCDTVAFDVAEPRFPCDVGAIVVPKCGRCHVPPGASCGQGCLLGPFPLSTWQDMHAEIGAQAAWERSAAAIETGFMPLRLDTLTPPVEPLSETEKQVLRDWFDACAPPADGVSCP